MILEGFGTWAQEADGAQHGEHAEPAWKLR